MKAKLTIFKIGGHVLEDEKALYRFLKAFSARPELKILVHGGGKKASQLARELNLTPQIINGRRVTDAKMLEVAMMVYAGLYNKKITAILQSLGLDAIGLSGADANTVLARKRPVGEVDFGFVGDVTRVNKDRLERFLEAGLVPVFCALSHDGQGQLLNTNADTIATEIARALSPVFSTELIFCFEKSGVLRNHADESTLIERLSENTFLQLKQQGIFNNGMLPKLDNAFAALRSGVESVRITHFSQLEKGTQITLD